MAKPPTELTDDELEAACHRTWKRYYEVVKEKNRRRMVERYGTDRPMLNEYSVEISVECESLTVKAKTSEEAPEIASNEIYLMTDAHRQIEFNDSRRSVGCISLALYIDAFHRKAACSQVELLPASSPRQFAKIRPSIASQS